MLFSRQWNSNCQEIDHGHREAGTSRTPARLPAGRCCREKAGQKIKEGTQVAAEKTAEAANNAGQAIKNAGQKIKDKSGA